MAFKRPSDDYVHSFHARVRKVAIGPTFLHFASSTPPDQVVSAVPTLLREFIEKEPSAPKVKPDPDTEPSPMSPSQTVPVRRSRSALPTASRREATPGVSLVPSVRASSVSSQPDPTHIGGLSRTTPSVVHAGSLGPPGAVLVDKKRGSRPATVGHVQLANGTASSASRAATARSPPQPEHFDELPILAPPSNRITRSLSRTLHSPKPKPALPSVDPGITGITAPEPMDPNDYVRYKKSCQLTDEEKGRNRKGKSAQQELVTAWFEHEGEYPLRHPPDLSGHNKIQHGDIFWYRSPYGIQLWQWIEGEDGGEDFWRAVTLGVCRAIDRRYLGLNPSQKPSWVTETWLGKQKKNSVRVFIFKAA